MLSRVRESIARLQQAAAAAATILKVMLDPATPPSLKVCAADSVFAHAAKAIEIEDIEVRLTELERGGSVESTPVMLRLLILERSLLLQRLAERSV